LFLEPARRWQSGSLQSDWLGGSGVGSYNWNESVRGNEAVWRQIETNISSLPKKEKGPAKRLHNGLPARKAGATKSEGAALILKVKRTWMWGEETCVAISAGE
jgi:hypothetical protein